MKLSSLALALLTVASACTKSESTLVCEPSCDASACQYCDTTGAEPVCTTMCGGGAVCQAGDCVPPPPAPTCSPACGACQHCDTSGATPVCASNCGGTTVCQDGACVAPPAVTCNPGCGPCEMCDTSGATPTCLRLCSAGSVCDAGANACIGSAAYHAELGAAGGALHGPFANAYAVTAACLTCHPTAATQVMASAHWTWAGPTPDLVAADRATAVNPGDVGKKNLVNNFCVGTASNDKRCDQCHAGYGGDPDASKPQKSARNYTSADPTTGDSSIPLANRIDCLACHADPTTGYAKDPKNFGLPTTAVNLATAAQDIRLPTRTNCGACHFYAGGADNVKLMGSSLKNPSATIDVHMGRGMECRDCHTERGHVFKGGGVHTPTHTARSSCGDCHTLTPHTGKSVNGDALDGHTDKIACQTCHIPKFSRGQFGKVDWDWSTAGDNTTCAGTPGTCTAGVVSVKVADDGVTPDPTASVGVTAYDYIKGNFKWQRNIVPTYLWSNGKATHMRTSDKLSLGSLGTTTDDSSRVSLGEPVGSPSDGKIAPFKLMRGRQAFYVDGANSFTINPNVFGPGSFWGVVQAPGYSAATYDFDAAGPITPGAQSLAALWGKILATGAVAAGQAPAGTTSFAKYDAASPGTPGYDWRYTKLYLDLNHEVAPKAQALGAASCNDCHGTAATRKLPLCELYAGQTKPFGVTDCP